MADENKSAVFGTAEFGYSYFNTMFKRQLIDALIEGINSNELSIDTVLSSGVIYKNQYIDALMSTDRSEKEVLIDLLTSRLDNIVEKTSMKSESQLLLEVQIGLPPAITL